MLPLALLAKYSILRLLIKWIRRIAILLFVFAVGFILIFRFIPLPFTPLMFVRLCDQSAAGKSWKLQRDWEPIENISLNFQKALLAAEDQRFFMHYGFDFEEIKTVVTSKEKKKRGASTISQQTAKNVFLWTGRSWVRKALEAGFTLAIEMLWGKKRILEIYMNVAEMGDGIYGIESAALHYYNKPASKLNLAEAATIVACLPNPLKMNPKQASNYVRLRTQNIMYQVQALDRIYFYKDLTDIQPKP